MAHELYLRIFHRKLTTCHPDSKACPHSFWTGKNKAVVELQWPRIIVGPEFMPVVNPPNRDALGKILHLQETYQLGRYSVPLHKFRVLISEIGAIAQAPPWQVCRLLKIDRGRPHPRAGDYTFLDRWLGWHEQCAETLLLEYWCNTVGWGPEGPLEAEIDL
ncbi:MAG: hypothetical protein JXR77_14775 [Lentisphaeria bacterium]|nr:hypothetical protein [Lentisphaeria bacterium]